MNLPQGSERLEVTLCQGPEQKGVMNLHQSLEWREAALHQGSEWLGVTLVLPRHLSSGQQEAPWHLCYSQ